MKVKLILASGSPRRKELLEKMGLVFSVKPLNVDETFPDNITPAQVAEYLAKKKSDACLDSIKENELFLTADTLVALDGKILNKPESSEHAIEMLSELSGKKHMVVTGVGLLTKQKQEIFHVVSTVFFNQLSDLDIEKYVASGLPMDKAGAYGIQDWIGTIGVSRIEGSYENIVGLPTQELYNKLRSFL